jgi:lactate racemase
MPKEISSMRASLSCGTDRVQINVPEDSVLYKSAFPSNQTSAFELIRDALSRPIGKEPLSIALQSRKKGDVVIVVSDITRPIPYSSFLQVLFKELDDAGVKKEEVLILIATGMHRPSTDLERRSMFGEEAMSYRMIDHFADNENELLKLDGQSWSGAPVKLNKHYVNAGFKIITGLVEPHFMAGYSGGRKSVCPGLADLGTLRNFHGYSFLSNPLARNGNLEGNPLHQEALSIARFAGVDYSLNVVLDNERNVAAAFAGSLEAAHQQACLFVKTCSCREVTNRADIVITSSGGYPLDATFYQCVKGMVSCLPAVKEGGTILAFGGCSEGVGSEEYCSVMKRYSGRWEAFLAAIANEKCFTKDQWQFQMHTRALNKVGLANLHFLSHRLDSAQIEMLSVTGHALRNETISKRLQTLFDSMYTEGMTVALFPEGPYCVPIEKDVANGLR